MKFAFGMPALILYPAIMSPWERDATPGDILQIARKAEVAGFDWLTISEHIVMPREMVDMMGARFPESLTAAAVLAGATERVKLLTYVLVLPYRNPVLLAKQIATLDFLSNGRVLLGTGGGHLEREFQALNVPFKERGKLTDEYLEVLKELWTSAEPSFKGRTVQFEGVAFEPKPVQKPHPPILIGGNSKPAMRRAARVGDGWLPWLVTREQLPDCLAFIRDQPGFADRKEEFEVVMPLATYEIEDYSHEQKAETHLHAGRQEILDEVAAHAKAGVTVTQVVPPRTSSASQLLEWIQWFGDEILPKFRTS